MRGTYSAGDCEGIIHIEEDDCVGHGPFIEWRVVCHVGSFWVSVKEELVFENMAVKLKFMVV